MRCGSVFFATPMVLSLIATGCSLHTTMVPVEGH